jgi:hypothetical protein
VAGGIAGGDTTEEKAGDGTGTASSTSCGRKGGLAAARALVSVKGFTGLTGSDTDDSGVIPCS